MWAKLKTGKVVSGKAADVFVKIGIATECEEPVKKVAVKAVKKVANNNNGKKGKK